MRVATWNLLHGRDVRTGRIDLPAVARVVGELDVEVLAVQEVDRALPRSGGADQVAELAAALGWHHVFAPALLGDPSRRWGPGPGAGPDPGGPAYGIGLLSRAPLRDVRRCALPGGGPGERRAGSDEALPGYDREPRALLAGRTAAGLLVATTHLSYLPWRAVRQLRTAVGHIAALAGPAVLLGDLNLPLRALRPVLGGTGWVPHEAAPTFPSWRPGLQIDHLLARGTTLHDVAVGPAGPSDHLPLSARVTSV
jgi:endonuclease/exonuclease/phosphatase family metal-dependent hydrolase